MSRAGQIHNRGICSVCKKDRAIRKTDGNVWAHPDAYGYRRTCPGSDLSPLADEPGTENDRCLLWGQGILAGKGADGWVIKFSPSDSCEGITLWGPKEIIIHWPDNEPDYALMAHEIAHVLAGQDAGHGAWFSHEYMNLVREFFVPSGPSSW